MDSIKVKNFIILVLLIVNAVLLSVFIADYARERELENSAVEGAIELLAENGISVAGDVDLSQRSLTVLSASRDTQLEAAHVSNVLGETAVTDLGGNILRYAGERGEANFRGTGSFEMLIYVNDLQDETPLEQARTVAERLGLNTAREPFSYDIDEDTMDGTLDLVCSVDSAAVVNCRLNFTFAAGNLRMVMGTRVLDNVAASSGESALDVPTVLMRFLSLVLERGHICSSLEGLELCYVMSANAAGDGELTPVWRVDTDTGSFYINAVTGLEESIT